MTHDYSSEKRTAIASPPPTRQLPEVGENSSTETMKAIDLDAVSSIRLLVPIKTALRHLPGSEVYLYQHRNAAYKVTRQIPVENRFSTEVWIELEKVTSGIVA